jgi:predicted  nucleic acid-binding Zn-ribbon protein
LTNLNKQIENLNIELDRLRYDSNDQDTIKAELIKYKELNNQIQEDFNRLKENNDELKNQVSKYNELLNKTNKKNGHE